MKRVFVALWVSAFAGCVPTTYAFTPSSNRALSPKPQDCAVEAMTAQPSKNYEELGTLEHYNGDVPKDVDVFKKAVARQVCQAGGDAVIAISNENGRFARGSVIKYVGPMAEPIKQVDTPTQQATDTEAMPAQ